MRTDRRKETVRQQLLENRRKVSAENLKLWSRQITRYFVSLPEFSQAKVIHCYLSIPGQREVETDSLIRLMKESGKKIVVPKVVTDSGNARMMHLELKNSSLLVENRWGIPEPVAGRKVEIHDLDLVIVPIVGADRYRNRLGYGKGFYDRFLAETDAVKVGLVVERYLLDEPLPVESFDIPMDILVTEKGIIR